VKLFVNVLLVSQFIFLGVSVTNAECGIPAYCAQYPALSLEDYPTVDVTALLHNLADYSWKQVHLVVRYTGIDKAYGYTRLICKDIDGALLDNLLFTISQCSRVDMEILNGLQYGDILGLFCMVESTLSSGKTIVMIEKLFIQDKR
jgi:hypothetical protein